MVLLLGKMRFPQEKTADDKSQKDSICSNLLDVVEAAAEVGEANVEVVSFGTEDDG